MSRAALRARLSMLGLAALIIARPLHAQGNGARIPAGTALGITVDRLYLGSGYHIHSATFHISALNPGNLSPEFAISLFPQTLAAGVLFTHFDVGGAINIPLPHATLLLRGGGSGFVALGRSAQALPGAHYGASILIRIAGKNGVRLDVLRRVYFRPYESSPPVLTVGMGITSLPGLTCH